MVTTGRLLKKEGRRRSQVGGISLVVKRRTVMLFVAGSMPKRSLSSVLLSEAFNWNHKTRVFAQLPEILLTEVLSYVTASRSGTRPTRRAKATALARIEQYIEIVNESN